MKIKLFILLTVIAAAVSVGFGAQTNDPILRMEVGLSPFYPSRDATRVHEAVVQLVLRAAPKSVVTIHDAWHLRVITRAEVPALRFDTPGARVRLLREPLGALSAWFKGSTNPPAALKDSGALKVPQWIDQISVQGGEEPRGVVFVGSPLYCSIEEPAFNMTPDLFPTDGHFRAPAEDTVFSVAQKEGRLTNAVIRWGYLNESLWANQLHADGTRRFWTLWFALQGGCLGSFTPDIESVLRAASERTGAPVGRYQVDEGESKVTMRVARPREVPRWMPQSVQGVNNTPTNRPVQTAPAQKGTGVATSVVRGTNVAKAAGISQVVRPSREARPVVLAIGLMWTARADIDLYVKVPGQAKELSFRNVLNQGGRYIHDYRDSNSRVDYEWVEIWDASVKPEDLEVWVNYFGGAAGPVSGQVCLYFQGKSYLGEFSIPAESGNLGVDALLRRVSRHWTRLDIARMVHQSPPANQSTENTNERR